MSLWRLITASCLIAPALHAATWLTDLDQGMAQAKREDKPLLVYFTGKWCVWCQRLDDHFLNQSSFDQLSHEMVFVKLEYPQNRDNFSAKQKQWKSQYQIFSYPSLLLLDSQGKLLGTLGYPRDGVVEFIAKIRAVAKLKQGWEKKEEDESPPAGHPPSASSSNSEPFNSSASTSDLNKAVPTKSDNKAVSANSYPSI